MQAHTLISARMSPAVAQTFAARNLAFLAAIESTLDTLYGDTRLLRDIADGYSEIKDRLGLFEGEIDPQGHIAAILNKASDTCVRIYRDAQSRHRSACNDPNLTEDDGVADAYTDFIAAITYMHDTVEELREWIATHDAVLQPTTGQVFTSTDDLFQSLLSDQ